MSLTPAQILVLKADILANTDPVFITYRPVDDLGQALAWYNTLVSPTFTVWKLMVSLTLIGDNMVSTELATRSSLDSTRLQTIAQYSPNGINPSMLDRRAFFDDIFSGAGGVLTRAKLLALWKRPATRVEKLFATGVGTDVSPASLAFEGPVSYTDFFLAWRL